ncbi:MAG: hypothetical protein ACKESB_03670 [Candidatus Hodgkinia cicadicola]
MLRTTATEGKEGRKGERVGKGREGGRERERRGPLPSSAWLTHAAEGPASAACHSVTAAAVMRSEAATGEKLSAA